MFKMKEKFQGQFGLQSGLQNNQGYYVEKSCLEKKKEKERNKTTSKPKKMPIILVGRVTWIFCEFEASLINTVSSRIARTV